MIIKDLQIKLAECNENTSYEDNVMKVQYVPLKCSLNADDSCSILDSAESSDSDSVSKDVQVGSGFNTVLFVLLRFFVFLKLLLI